MPHAKVGGCEKEAAPRSLTQVLLGKLPELKLEFLRRVDTLLHQKRIHGIHRRAEAFVARELFHSLLVANEFLPLSCHLLGTIYRRSRHKNPPGTAILRR